MTAEHIPAWAPDEWVPDPARQRAGDYTVDDVLNLPDDAPRVELLDGVMLVVPSPTIGHQDIGNLLWAWFRTNAPAGYRVATAVGIRLDLKNGREPDLILLREPVSNRHYFTPDEVVIAVEVVSPNTRKRDRLQKPAEYADAGIPFYWRIEQDPTVHVYAYGLKHGAYAVLADSDTLLKLDEPFGINLPIEAIRP